MKLKKIKENPVLKPNRDNWWESEAVFNCGTFYKDGKVHMLYRALGKDKAISRLGYATSQDGVNFKRESDSPVFGPGEKYDRFGTEDARIVKLKNKILLTYVAISEYPLNEGKLCQTALAETKDFRKFNKLGVITPKNVDDRDTVIFPEKFNGLYAIIHRPQQYMKRAMTCYKEWKTGRPSSIWIAYCDKPDKLRNFKQLKRNKVLMRPRQGWESQKIGVGPPPIKTKYGWLLIYHGVSHEKRGFVYRVGAALLDLKDPFKVIARTKEPILEPEKSYETHGITPNAVFPTGAFILGKELFVYYGAADKVCCLAKTNLSELLSYLRRN